MKTNFSVPQIAEIAKKVRTYKTLFVTTKGQMFRNLVDAEEAVRTLNLIVEDANDHVGILPITEEMLSVEKLKIYGKSPMVFGKLFSEAKIPVSKNDTKKEHKRMREAAEADAADIVDDVEVALGIKLPAADVKTPVTGATSTNVKPNPIK